MEKLSFHQWISVTLNILLTPQLLEGFYGTQHLLDLITLYIDKRNAE